MEFINSWKIKNKKWGRFALKLRIGKITILDIYAGDTGLGISVFNIGVKQTKRKRHD